MVDFMGNPASAADLAPGMAIQGKPVKRIKQSESAVLRIVPAKLGAANTYDRNNGALGPETRKMTECSYCESERVVPVLDKRMEGTVKRWGGNRFRSFCRTCRKFGAFTSREAWELHLDARILPADADPGDPELLDANGDELENRFVCPNTECDTVHKGYPEECDVCSAPYFWDETNE